MATSQEIKTACEIMANSIRERSNATATSSTAFNNCKILGTYNCCTNPFYDTRAFDPPTYNVKLDRNKESEVKLDLDDQIKASERFLQLYEKETTKQTDYSGIPSRKMIFEQISEYQDYDVNVDRYSVLFSYKKDNINCYRRMYSYRDQDPEEIVAMKQECIDYLIDDVTRLYKEQYIKEATDMDCNKYYEFEKQIQMLHGHINLEFETTGFMREIEGTAKIELPTQYLKFLTVQIPKTDYGSVFDQKVPAPNFAEGIPLIKKIETYNDRVTKVTFADNTFTKAVCSDNDHFDLDVGITICCMKKMMGKDGNRVYNDLIRHAHKVIADNDIAKEKAAKEKAEAKHKKRKAEMHRIAKKLKAKEEQIDIQKQAIIRAHQEMEGLTSEKA